MGKYNQTKSGIVDSVKTKYIAHTAVLFYFITAIMYCCVFNM